MKKICAVLLLLPVLGIDAAAGEQPLVGMSKQPEKWWNDATLQDGRNGVRIETFMQDARETNNPPASRLAARQIPWRLALELKSDDLFFDARNMIERVFCDYETESAATQDAATRGIQISRMLILISLAQSGVKIRVEGEADPATFVTFFPPYTITKLFESK